MQSQYKKKNTAKYFRPRNIIVTLWSMTGWFSGFDMQYKTLIIRFYIVQCSAKTHLIVPVLYEFYITDVQLEKHYKTLEMYILHLVKQHSVMTVVDNKPHSYIGNA